MILQPKYAEFHEKLESDVKNVCSILKRVSFLKQIENSFKSYETS